MRKSVRFKRLSQGGDPYLHPIEMKKAKKNEAWVATAARLALDSPNRFPTRTTAAMLKEYGAW